MCLDHAWLIFFKKASFRRKKPFEKSVDHVFKPGRSYV